MPRPVSLQKLLLHERNRKKDYVLQEMKKVIEGEIERKVICVSGYEDEVKDLVKRLKMSAAMKGVKVVENGKLPKTEGKKVYIYKTSELKPGDDFWIGKNHPDFVLILEDSREFKGECEKLKL